MVLRQTLAQDEDAGLTTPCRRARAAHFTWFFAVPFPRRLMVRVRPLWSKASEDNGWHKAARSRIVRSDFLVRLAKPGRGLSAVGRAITAAVGGSDPAVHSTARL
ncbi:MAG: hypothetical protein V7641_2096 [Blastocatellia bacterium]